MHWKIMSFFKLRRFLDSIFFHTFVVFVLIMAFSPFFV